MFLSMLNENEKRYFGRLINIVANCDNDFSEKERAIIEEYKKEMGVYFLEPVDADIDDIIDFFAMSSNRVKNAVFVETVALVMADERYENAEKDIIEKMAKSFGISENKIKEYFEWVQAMQLLYKRIFDLIGE